MGCVDIDEEKLHIDQCKSTSVYFDSSTLDIKSKAVSGFHEIFTL